VLKLLLVIYVVIWLAVIYNLAITAINIDCREDLGCIMNYLVFVYFSCVKINSRAMFMTRFHLNFFKVTILLE